MIMNKFYSMKDRFLIHFKRDTKFFFKFYYYYYFLYIYSKLEHFYIRKKIYF